MGGSGGEWGGVGAVKYCVPSVHACTCTVIPTLQEAGFPVLGLFMTDFCLLRWVFNMERGFLDFLPTLVFTPAHSALSMIYVYIYIYLVYLTYI